MARVSNQYATVLRTSLGSQKMAAISMNAEWLFQRILVAVDCAGRYHGDAFEVACKLCTARMKAGQIQVPDVQAWLDELENVGLVARYIVEGEALLRVVEYFRPPNSKIKPVFKPDPNEGNAFPSSAESIPLIGRPTQHNTTEHNTASSAREGAEPTEAEPPSPDDGLADARASDDRKVAGWQPWPDVPAPYTDLLRPRIIETLEALAWSVPVLPQMKPGLVAAGLAQALLQHWGQTPEAPQMNELVAMGPRGTKAMQQTKTWIVQVTEAARQKANPKAYVEAALRNGPKPEAWQVEGFWKPLKERGRVSA